MLVYIVSYNDHKNGEMILKVYSSEKAAEDYINYRVVNSYKRSSHMITVAYVYH